MDFQCFPQKLRQGRIRGGGCLLYTSFLALAAAVIYRRRKSEMAENTSTGGILKVFIKIASTYLASLLMGFIFEGVFGVGSDDSVSYTHLDVYKRQVGDSQPADNIAVLGLGSSDFIQGFFLWLAGVTGCLLYTSLLLPKTWKVL